MKLESGIEDRKKERFSILLQHQNLFTSVAGILLFNMPVHSVAEYIGLQFYNVCS
jgi:hypothetical protein